MKLKIGEFSKLNQVTVKTLRFYEEMGLLLPVSIDNYTGYRYYEVWQMQTMNTIASLKQLGFGLEEIKRMMDAKQLVPSLEMIEAKQQQCRAEIDNLRQREKVLEQYKNFLRNKKTMEKFIIKSLPAITVASFRKVVSGYQELFNLCPNVIGPEMARLGCVCAEPGYCFTVDHSKEYREKDVDLEYCEAVTEKKENTDLLTFRELPLVPKALCYSHYGPYEKFPQTWEKIYSYLETNGYKIADNPRFCYIDGIWNKEDENDWLTEIQVPLVEA